MSLAQANKNLKYDTRMSEAKINAGEMTREELNKHLEQLPDLASNVETFTIDGKNSKDEDSH
jgi:hypothetical protein